MRCEETRERIQRTLEGGELPAPAGDHLAACRACREWRAALLGAHEALEAEATLPWRPELTAAVLLRRRRERSRHRLAAAAVAALLLGAAWLGAGLLAPAPFAERAGEGLAARIPLPPEPAAALRSLAAELGSLVESALHDLPAGPGLPGAAAGLVLLLLLNCLAIKRRRTASGRHA